MFGSTRLLAWRSLALSVAALLLLLVALPASDANASGGQVIMGVGLVVGLPGTGDTGIDPAFVDNSIVGVLKRAGMDLWHGQIVPGRAAKVIVIAQLPEKRTKGARLTVSVSAVGNAVSLAGGMLLPTPLRDQTGSFYAIGQGLIDVRGLVVGGAAIDQGHPEQLAREQG